MVPLRRFPFLNSLSISGLAALMLLASAWGQGGVEREERITRLLPEFDKVVNEYAKAFVAPGVAIAIVTPLQAHYLALGVRENGKAAPIDPATIFQLASVSKPITATFAAVLVSQKRLQWKSGITSLLPGFTFADASVTRRTTVLDMLSQRSGLPGGTGDFLETLGYSQERILNQMRLVDTAENFREQWAYANFGITIGGNAAAAVTGKSFDEAIRRELFRPAGMRTAFIDYKRLTRTKNRARLHFTIDGVSQPLFVRDAESEAPGGGMNASVRDLAALLQIYLNEGRVGRRQLIDPEVLKQTYVPISDIGHGTHYGICWNVVTDSDGKIQNVNHSGAFFAGARTAISFWPAEGVGIAVLTNNFPSFLPEALAEAFHELYTTGKVSAKTLPKFEALSQTVFDVSADVERLKKMRDVAGSVNGRPLSAYAGVFQNDYVGPVEIRIESDSRTKRPTLVLVTGPMKTPVKIKQWGDPAELVSINAEGDEIEYDFKNLKNGRFEELHFSALKPIGWQKLKRVR